MSLPQCPQQGKRHGQSSGYRCIRSHFARKKDTLARAKRTSSKAIQGKACIFPIPEQHDSEYLTAHALVKEM